MGEGGPELLGWAGATSLDLSPVLLDTAFDAHLPRRGYGMERNSPSRFPVSGFFCSWRFLSSCVVVDVGEGF